MIVVLSSGLSGMQSQAANLSVIANNLANMSTTGFKKSRVEFQDTAYQRVSGGSVGSGVTVSGIDKIFSQSSLMASGNSLDLSIEGDGFFQVSRPDGSVVFTRDGAFSVDGMGRMVNSSGYVLNPQINIPQDTTNISVAGDGTVSVTRAGAAAPQVLGQIQLAKFNNPQGLVNLGNNVFGPTANSGAPLTGTATQAGFGSIAQGFLEMSNVDIVEEMTSMMLAQRAYEANIKVVKAGDEMFAATIDLLK